MGLELHSSSPEARRVWESADVLLGQPISALAFGGPEESLRQTKNAQLALFVSEVAALRALEGRGVSAGLTAGHSIGEYAALVAAGAISFEVGLGLVQIRGEAMERAASERPGTMAAVLGLGARELEALLAEASSTGVVQVANLNSAEQIVISGEVEAVELAGKLASEAGAKRVVPLAVSGGFHSPLMESASADLAAALASADISDPGIPVLLNVTADFARGAGEIRESLARQVVSQVRWHESMARLIASGCDAAIEAGPGKVLAGLLRRMDNAPVCYPVETKEDLETAVRDLEGGSQGA